MLTPVSGIRVFHFKADFRGLLIMRSKITNGCAHLSVFSIVGLLPSIFAERERALPHEFELCFYYVGQVAWRSFQFFFVLRFVGRKNLISTTISWPNILESSAEQFTPSFAIYF
jgi:hypothetical protein